jgi:hypothetical protein
MRATKNSKPTVVAHRLLKKLVSKLQLPKKEAKTEKLRERMPQHRVKK